MNNKIENKVYNMDCIEGMKMYPDKYFDLAVVDPPYGININESIGRRKGDKHSGHKKTYWDKSIPNKEYFNELFRVSKNQIIWGGNYMTEYLPPTACWLLWDKGFSEDVTFAQFEMAWTSFNISAKKYDKHPSQQDKIHPTQKPIKLYEWILQRFSLPTDKILDTHLGSGSSRIAAHKAKLSFVGFEIDSDYYNASIKRYELAIQQQTLF
jgi:site-specific DNA-methyltransferase (adenine-specific)